MTSETEWLAGLRPSRIREIQAGATWGSEVDLVDIESGVGDALRQALETFGLRVNRFPVGQARHLVQALSMGRPAPFVFLACHGDKGSIVLPELDPELERFQPFHEGVSPESLRSFAPVFLFYELAEKKTLTEAIQRLAAHDRELGMWRLHT